jgi:peptidoglycan/xylan/chitin deacetylase (PgdA/CDA1 family)
MRWGLAELWRASGRVRGDRRLLYGGASGLRILTFHETLGEDLRRLQRIVEWCRSRFAMGTPADADQVAAGRWPHGSDRILVTFDDGWESNFEAARWLASIGVSAIFFVVPSLIGRTADEYLTFHTRNGVTPHVPEGSSGARGLSPAQLREMRAMGHRIGAHNFAHRDLGSLHALADLRHEIDNALQSLNEILGARCEDFAIAYGMPYNVSEEAISHLKDLQARGIRIYSCHRGLNVPGKTPSFLLRHPWAPVHPMNFTRLCIEGGADRHLGGWIQQMVRRVGALPLADQGSIPALGAPP